jgi:hypothetical protein
MLVCKDNYKDLLPLFKESLEQCDFLSFDCEMSGITYDLRNEGTKYDTHELRYLKCKEIVKRFELIQFGVTFYIRDMRDDKSIYLERTFTFSLFKNSKLKFLSELYSNNSEMELFNSIPMFHPAALKFLNENKFDFNRMINKGIHFNKLCYADKIEKLLQNHYSEGKVPGNIVYLSKTNENKVLDTLREILKFLLETWDPKQAYSNNDKAAQKKKKITGLNVFIMNYILSMNLKNLFKFSQYNLTKDKTTTDTLIVEKSKANLNVKEFYDTYETYENFCGNVLNIDLLYKTKYHQFILEKEKHEEILEEEIGFAKYIKLISESKKAMIGHNFYFDMMFIYEKFINDLPETFFEYKTEINNYFPELFDTKFITSKFAKEFDNTKLESIYRNMLKYKYNEYVQISPDAINGFCNYIDGENSAFHDAGYDSVITGRCFIYLLKGLENNFEKDFTKTKNGFIDFDNIKLAKDFCNRSCTTLIPEPYDIYHFSQEGKDNYLANQQKIIGINANVYVVKAKELNPTIYELANMFENDYFNTAVLKIHDNMAFVELMNNSSLSEEESFQRTEELLKVIADRIEYIVTYQEFIANPNNYLKL